MPAVCLPVLSWVTRRTAKESSVPGLAQQVLEFAYCPDLSTLRGLVNSLLEAEDMPLDFGPWDLLPGRRQALAILRFGSLPLTHHFPFSTPPRRQHILGITPGLGFFRDPSLPWHPVGTYSVR